MPLTFKKLRDFKISGREYLKFILLGDGSRAAALTTYDREVVALDLSKSAPRMLPLGPKRRPKELLEITGAIFRYEDGFGVVLRDSVKIWNEFGQTRPTVFKIRNPHIPNLDLFEKVTQAEAPVWAAYRPEDESIVVVFNQVQDRWKTSHVARLWLHRSAAEYDPSPAPLSLLGRKDASRSKSKRNGLLRSLPDIEDVEHGDGKTTMAMSASSGSRVGELSRPTHVGRWLYKVPAKFRVQFLSDHSIGWLAGRALHFFDPADGKVNKMSLTSTRFKNSLNHSVDHWMRFDRLGDFVWIGSYTGITAFELS